MLGTAQLPAVGDQQQARPVGDPEGTREVLGRTPPLVVGEPEPDHPAAGVLPGQAGQGAGVERVAGAVGGDDHGDAQPGPPGRVLDAVEHQVGEGGDAAEARGIAAGVDLDLQPPAPVPDVVLGRLEHQSAYVLGRAQHRAGHVVEALEAEPALLVGRAELRRPVLHERVRQGDLVALGQLQQRLVAHRSGEVQVEMGLGEARQVTTSVVGHGRSPHGGILGGRARWAGREARFDSGWMGPVCFSIGGFATCFGLPGTWAVTIGGH